MNKQILIASLISSLTVFGFSSSTFAKGSNDINWDYLSAGYKSLSYDEDDGFDVDFSGVSLEGSFSLTNEVFVFGELDSLSDDINIYGTKIDLDMTHYRLGVGYAYAYDAKSSVFGAVGFTNVETEAKASGMFNESDDLDGYFIRGGVRSKLTQDIELFGFATYSTYDIDSEFNDVDDDETTITLGGRYYVQPQFTLNASYEIVDDGGAFVLGASYLF